MTLTLERCENCNGQTPDRDEFGRCHNCRGVLTEQQEADARVIAEHHAQNNVAVTVCAGPEVRMLTNIANDMEAMNDNPRLVWMRDSKDRIIGITLVGHLSRETVGRVPELRCEPVGEP